MLTRIQRISIDRPEIPAFALIMFHLAVGLGLNALLDYGIISTTVVKAVGYVVTPFVMVGLLWCIGAFANKAKLHLTNQ